MNVRLPQSIHRQRGAASLIVALVLLFGGTLIVFFANRGLIFEQRTSANQFRATSAFELAEAGVEWAVGKLNEQLPLDTATVTSCATGGAGGLPTFRDRYAYPSPPTPSQPNSHFNLPTNPAVRPYAQCRFDPAAVATNGGWTCDCPGTVAAIASIGSPEQGRFGVRFNPALFNPNLPATPGNIDYSAVEVVARGCTSGASCDPIDPVAAPTDRDATSLVRVLVKIRPSISGGPTAALTSGSATTTAGSLNVINQHAPSNGITIHSGTSVETGGGNRLYTLPGTPVSASVLDNDPSLYNLTTADEDAFFARFFGETLTSYREPGHSITLSSTNGGTNGDAIRARVATGERGLRFFVDGPLSFSGGATPPVGSADNPVIVVVRGNLEITGGVVAHGIFYSATSTAVAPEDPGAGGAVIYGAYIVRGAFQKQGNGNFSIVYTPTLWGSGVPSGQLIKVPGSWRDF